MKRTFLSLLITAILVITAIPVVFAVSSGSGIGIDITPEDFAPRIWMCDARAVIEDCVEAGRTSDCAQNLTERIENYAFEGEQLKWRVLVMDKNKIEEIQDVVGTIGPTQGKGNAEQVECQRVTGDPYATRDKPNAIPDSCNARIDEQKLTTFDSTTMAFYDCIFTVETPDSMHGEFFITAEARTSGGKSATMDENEFWFLNPVVAVTVDGALSFANVRPGSVAYSNTLTVGNDAEQGSGVLMDMFVSGTDFYDPADSGAKCPTTNHLKLSQDARSFARLGPGLASSFARTVGNTCNADTANGAQTGNDGGVPGGDGSSPPLVTGLSSTDNADHLCYFATNGAYGTKTALNTDPRADPEGYVPIVYGDAFSRDYYNDAEIISQPGLGSLIIGGFPYHQGNVLSPGAEIALTFKLAMPEPCIGNFNAGQIHFWGEAI